MRSLLALLALSAGASALAAQTSVQLTAGVTSSGALVTDGVLRTRLQPTVAPTIGLAVALPTGKGPFRALFAVHYTHSTLRATDLDAGTTDDIGTLATIDAVVMAEGPVTGALRWQFGGGAVFYRPADRQGVFVDGPVQRWLLAGGLVWTRPMSPGLRLLIGGNVDNHTFTSDVLVARNYAGTQGVIRVGLHAGIERTF